MFYIYSMYLPAIFGHKNINKDDASVVSINGAFFGPARTQFYQRQNWSLWIPISPGLDFKTPPQVSEKEATVLLFDATFQYSPYL